MADLWSRDPARAVVARRGRPGEPLERPPQVMPSEDLAGLLIDADAAGDPSAQFDGEIDEAGKDLRGIIHHPPSNFADG